MKAIWKKDYQGIDIGYRAQAVHIRADEALRTFLSREGNGALLLSDHIHRQYEALIGRALEIGRDSLAIEILGHVYVDKLAAAIENVVDGPDGERQGPIVRLMEKVQRRTEVIDCGEAAIDHDRFVWDTLAKLHGFIYLILGDKA